LTRAPADRLEVHEVPLSAMEISSEGAETVPDGTLLSSTSSPVE
jgi:hypothetical protein